METSGGALLEPKSAPNIIMPGALGMTLLGPPSGALLELRRACSGPSPGPENRARGRLGGPRSLKGAQKGN